MTVDEVIGRNVHHLMWEKRIQHRNVYESMGLTRGSLSKKLRGDVTWSAADIATVASVLDVAPGDLFDGLPAQRGAQVTRDKVARPAARRLWAVAA